MILRLVSLLVLLQPVAALAADSAPPIGGGFDAEPGAPNRMQVIQNRKYELVNEISLSVGGFPADPYYKGLAASIGYTFHFNDSLAWEIAQFTYSYDFDSSLKTKLLQTVLDTGGTPPEFPQITWMVASHLVIKPFYGKEALFNTRVVHLEAYAQVGPAFLSRAFTKRKYGYGIDLGIGARLWMTKVTSLRLDMGEVVYALPPQAGKPIAVAQALHLHLGIAFNIRSSY